MALSDEDLLAFDHAGMADSTPEKALRLLDEQPELYRNHLVQARFLDGWALRMFDVKPEMTEDRFKGWQLALENVAAYLRQGYFLPGGYFYTQEQERSHKDLPGL